MRNLRLGYLYDLLPDVVVSGDIKNLIQGVVAAMQDRTSETRSLIGQLQEIWTPGNNVGTPRAVVAVTLLGDATITPQVLDLPPGEVPVALSVWAADQLKVNPDQITSIYLTTSTAMTALSQTNQLLANTVGAKIYSVLLSAQQSTASANSISAYFALLPIKGSAKSLEILAVLHGFSGSSVVPLWSRLSPRNPADARSPQNDGDFSHSPQVPVTPGQPTAQYDPTDQVDGEYYQWVSPSLSVDSSAANYCATVINGANPYLNIVSAGPVLPLAGVYYLTGGSEGTAASALLAGTDGTGVLVEALYQGECYNGTPVTVALPTASTFTLTVNQSLSRIKYLSSFFSFFAWSSYDSYAAENTGYAQASTTLQASPAYWAAIPDQPVGFANSGTAYDPYRPWYGGSKPQPTVTLWPDVSSSAGMGSVVVRTQAPITALAIDFAALVSARQSLSTDSDSVRLATRSPRTVSAGLEFESTPSWAAFPASFSVSNLAVGLHTVTPTGPGVDLPYGDFTGVLVATITSSGVLVPVSAETDPTNADSIRVRCSGSGVAFTGLFSRTTGQLVLTVTAVPAGGWTLTAVWSSTDYEVIGTEPSGAKRYKLRVESGPVVAVSSMLDEVQRPRAAIWAGIDVKAGGPDLLLDGVKAEPVAEYCGLVDEAGQDCPISVFNTGSTDRGYIMVQASNGLPRGKAVAGTVPVADVQTFYTAGLVLGVPVADPFNRNTPALSDGLVCWYRLAEHPDEKYRPVDYSGFDILPSELEAGAFSGSYSAASRVWDSNRGWMLSLQAGQQLKIAKDRPIDGHWSFSCWYKVGSSQPVAAIPVVADLFSVSVLSSTVTFTLGGVVIGTASRPTAPAPLWLAIRKIDESRCLPVTKALHADTALTGLPVGLAVGDTVLLDSQADPKQNGVYAVCTSIWYRLAVLDGADERGKLYLADDGIYACTNKTAITYGTTNIAYLLVTAEWSGTPSKVKVASVAAVTGVATVTTTGSHGLASGQTVAIFNSSQTALNGTWPIAVTGATTFTINYFASYTGAVTGAEIVPDTWTPANIDLAQLTGHFQLVGPSVGQSSYSDVMFWAEAKSLADFWSVAFPRFVPCPDQYPAFVPSNLGDVPLEVVPAGYVYPATWSTNRTYAILRRLTRYNFAGEYTGPESTRLVGLGNAQPLDTDPTLGIFGLGVAGSGLVEAGSTFGVSADRNLTVPYFMAVGSDGLTYLVWPKVTKTGPDYSVALEARLPTPMPAPRPHANQQFFGFDPVSLFHDQAPQGPISSPAIASVGEISVDASTQPVVVTVESSSATRPNSYLLSQYQQILDYIMPEDWPVEDISYSVPGVPVPARNTAGPISLTGPTVGLYPGKYKMAIDASAWGPLDPAFAGFKVAVSVTGYGSGLETSASATGYGVVCPAGRGSYSLATSLRSTGAVYDNAVPTGNSVTGSIQDAVDTLYGASNFVVLVSPSYPSKAGGPYWIQATNTGTQETPLVLLEQSVRATVTVEQAGGVSTQARYRIDVVRPISLIDFTLPVAIATGASWRVNVYLINPLSTASTSRTMAIHRLAVFQVSPILYNVGLSGGGSITIARFTDFSGPSTVPGGFVQAVNEYSVITGYHEISVTPTDTDTPRLSGLLSLADTLTGSSDGKNDWLIGTRSTLADTGLQSANYRIAGAQIQLISGTGTWFVPAGDSSTLNITLAVSVVDTSTANYRRRGGMLELLFDDGSWRAPVVTGPAYSPTLSFLDVGTTPIANDRFVEGQWQLADLDTPEYYVPAVTGADDAPNLVLRLSGTLPTADVTVWADNGTSSPNSPVLAAVSVAP